MLISKYETLCLIPVVQTGVAGIATAGNAVLLGVKLGFLAHAYINKKNISPTINYKANYRNIRLSFKDTLNALEESASRMVPLYGTVVAGKTFKLTAAESLSLIPGVNVAVGLATVITNICKIAAKAFANREHLSFRNLFFYKRMINSLNEDMNKNELESLAYITTKFDDIWGGIGRMVPFVSTGYYFAKINLVNS